MSSRVITAKGGKASIHNHSRCICGVLLQTLQTNRQARGYNLLEVSNEAYKAEVIGSNKD